MPNQAPPQNPLDDFDPNDKPKHPFATYCPSRWNGGSFKLHSARAHALAALKNQRYGTLYEFVGGKWTEVARFEHPEFRKDRCDACGRNTMEYLTRYDYQTKQTVTMTDRPKRNVISQVFERHNGRLVDPLKVLALCPGCKSGLKY